MVSSAIATAAARGLRCRSTDAERMFWFRVRDRRLHGRKFRRQVPVAGYVVDFLCAEAKLIVEIDGGQHAARGSEDAARTRVLESAGYLVLRFWNNDVLKNIEGVMQAVVATLRPDAPHPDPLPDGERE